MGLLPVEEIVVAVQVLFVAKLALKQGLRVRTTVRSLDVFLQNGLLEKPLVAQVAAVVGLLPVHHSHVLQQGTSRGIQLIALFTPVFPLILVSCVEVRSQSFRIVEPFGTEAALHFVTRFRVVVLEVQFQIERRRQRFGANLADEFAGLVVFYSVPGENELVAERFSTNIAHVPFETVFGQMIVQLRLRNENLVTHVANVSAFGFAVLPPVDVQQQRTFAPVATVVTLEGIRIDVQCDVVH